MVALVVLAAGGGAYAIKATSSSHGTASGTTTSAEPTGGLPVATSPESAIAGQVETALPSYLQIQAQFGGCNPASYYTETAAEYQQGQRKGGWRVGGSAISITNQTSSPEAVLLTSMRVLILHQNATPSTGIVVGDGGCGAAQDVRPFSFNLDRPSSPVIAQSAPGGPGDPTGHPPVAFPFKILPGDPEVFELTANDTTCDCDIAVEIDWVAAGKPGRTILNNNGMGFRVLAAPNVPAYKLGGTNYTQLESTTYQEVTAP